MQTARAHRMRMRLNPSEDQFDHLRETQYCIKFSKQDIETRKKQSFLNKCSFDYSLQKINREKFYGNIIPFSAKIYPATTSRGNRYCHYQYSSDQVKQTRKKMLSQRYRNRGSEEIHKDQFRKFKNILTKKKNQQGGIDSFWMFKKDPIREEKKKPKGQGGSGGEGDENEGGEINKTEQSFLKLLQYGKQPLQIESALVPRNTVKNYIASIFGQTFTLWFISNELNIADFYQIKAYVNFKQFESICEKFKNISLRECHMVSFFLFDDNGDGFLCPRDLFAIFQRQLSFKIDKDILKIGQFAKASIGKETTVNEEYKIENVCIRDDWLTIKDYEMYFKKVDEPYLKATNKKDTVFSKSFAVLDHREKIRSKRRQMNEKKNFYEQLYGQIQKNKKNESYIDSAEDYKLNFSILVEIFGKNSTQLYNFFTSSIFGLDPIFN